jgi:hypothetical protein
LTSRSVISPTITVPLAAAAQTLDRVESHGELFVALLESATATRPGPI